jgi:hypothetical protein
LLQATLTAPAVTADLVRQALRDHMTELTAVLTASFQRRPRLLAAVPAEDVKDGVLKANGLQQAPDPTTAVVRAFAAASASAAPAVSVSAAAAASALPAVAASAAGDETRPAACPVEPLRESIASMEALLQEWFEGLKRSPSVRELEERFGCRWRYTSALR